MAYNGRKKLYKLQKNRKISQESIRRFEKWNSPNYRRLISVDLNVDKQHFHIRRIFPVMFSGPLIFANSKLLFLIKHVFGRSISWNSFENSYFLSYKKETCILQDRAVYKHRNNIAPTIIFNAISFVASKKIMPKIHRFGLLFYVISIVPFYSRKKNVRQ